MADIEKQSSAVLGLDARQEAFFREQKLGMLLLKPAKRLVRPFAWAGHIAFARVLVRLMRPQLVVELGTHTGNSFSAFCEAVTDEGLAARCHAVDTWEGDSQAGFYGDDVYAELSPYIGANYGGFASLLRMTFDEAVDKFEDGSVDLLHIDGLHTYEAVKHDFETWKNKLSPRGVVLFHDTCVFDRGFGVHKLWTELSGTHPGFEFHHSHGLGVLLVGEEVAPALREFVSLAADDPEPVRAVFERAALASLPAEAVSYQNRFGSMLNREMENIDCELFLDRGKGFSEEEKLICSVGLDQGSGTVSYDLARFSEGLARVRFDPGHEAIALERFSAEWQDANGAWHVLKNVKNTALAADDGTLMLADDPWIELGLPEVPVKALKVELKVKWAGKALVSPLFAQLRGLTVECMHNRERLAALEAEIAAQRQAENELRVSLAEQTARLEYEIAARQEAASHFTQVLAEKERLLQSEIAAHEEAARKLWQDIAEKDRQLQSEAAAHEAAMAEKDRYFQTELAAHEAAEKKLWEDVAEKDRNLEAARKIIEHPACRALAALRLVPKFK